MGTYLSALIKATGRTVRCMDSSCLPSASPVREQLIVATMESPACCRALRAELDKRNASLSKLREAVKLLKVSQRESRPGRR